MVLFLTFCWLIGGMSLIRFNWKNILCDKYFYAIQYMEKEGMYGDILVDGEKAHSYNNYRTDVLASMGRAYLETGATEKAVEILEEVINKNPYNLNALFILGVAYTNADRTEKAFETFRRVLKLKPDFPQAQKIVCSLKTQRKARIRLS